MKRAGLFLALAALLVNGPRLVLIFLKADGIALPTSVEGTVLAITGIATGAVLTGGGMYIAHALGRPTRGGIVRFLLMLCWLALLGFSVVLIAPALVAAIRASEMVTVLDDPRKQWAWAVVAVSAVEILAGGSMLASALDAEPVARQARRTSQPGALSVLAGAIAKRIEAGAPSQVPAVERPAPAGERSHTTGIIPTPEQAARAREARRRKRDETMNAMLYILSETPDISPTELARRLGVSRSSVYRYFAALEAAGRIERNGHGVMVLDGGGAR